MTPWPHQKKHILKLLSRLYLWWDLFLWPVLWRQHLLPSHQQHHRRKLNKTPDGKLKNSLVSAQKTSLSLSWTVAPTRVWMQVYHSPTVLLTLETIVYHLCLLLVMTLDWHTHSPPGAFKLALSRGAPFLALWWVSQCLQIRMWSVVVDAVVDLAVHRLLMYRDHILALVNIKLRTPVILHRLEDMKT